MFRSLAAVLLASGVLTLVMAAPVARHPTEQTFGIEFAGRYRDPFVVMRQYETGAVPPPFLQPATDGPGIALGRVAGGVPAYNAVNVLSFPLSALTAFMLAWTLTRSPMASAVAALAFAWAPFHIAQASYHVHIAQVQWLPLYLLTLWRVVERMSPARIAAAGTAGALLCAASFYWGLIGAVMTPVALIAAAAVMPHVEGRSWVRRLAPAALLALAIAVTTVVVLSAATLLMPGDPGKYAFTPSDQSLYQARWSSYLLPPFDHPVVGEWARARAAGAGVVEQQVGPGWSVLLLAVAGAILGLRARGTVSGAVAWLLTLAAVAAACSTAPIASMIFKLSPLFRAHARFGGVVTLAAAVLAGIGAAALWQRRGARPVAAALLILAAMELRPLAVRARDVLPTPGYRWLAQQQGEWRVLECTPPGREYGPSVTALLGARAGFREPPFDDCAEPGLAGKLARFRFTHLLLRNGSREGRWLARGGALADLAPAADSIDDRVLAVKASAATVFVSGVIGFHDREFGGSATWRWMPREARWLVTNATASPLVAALELRAAAFEGARHLEAWAGGTRAAAVKVHAPGWYRLDGIPLAPGETSIAFRVPEGDVRAAAILRNGDQRALAIRFDDWRWTTAPPESAR